MLREIAFMDWNKETRKYDIPTIGKFHCFMQQTHGDGYIRVVAMIETSDGKVHTCYTDYIKFI